MASPDSAAKSAAASATSAAASAQAAATALEETVNVFGLPSEAAAQVYNIQNNEDVKAALSASYVRVADEPINLATRAALAPNATHDELLAGALADVATAGGGRILLPPHVPWSFAADHEYDNATGPLVLDAQGATINYSGSGRLLTFTSSTGGGGATPGALLLGGKWIGTAVAEGIFRCLDSSRNTFVGAWIGWATNGIALELRNEKSYCEQTVVDRCILSNSKHAFVTNPQSITGGIGGTQSFARTRVSRTVIANGTAGEALLVLNGGVYNSEIRSIGGNLNAGAHVCYLNGDYVGSTFETWGFEHGDASSRVFLAGPDIGVNLPLIYAIRALAPITIDDESMESVNRWPFHVRGGGIFGTKPAASGQLRLPNNQSIRSRNAANDGDVEIARIGSDDWLVLGGYSQPPGVLSPVRHKFNDGLQLAGGGLLLSGSGDPEGVVTAPVGSVYLRHTDGTHGFVAYTKGFGSAAIGWQRISSSHRQTLATKTGAYTLVRNDAGMLLSFDSATPVALTLPANSGTSIEAGHRFSVYNAGAGTVTITPDAGVTVRGSTAIAQYQDCEIRKVATNEWKARVA